jgi:hypothetical protein
LHDLVLNVGPKRTADIDLLAGDGKLHGFWSRLKKS